MNPLPAGLDRGITYLKNIIVHCDGVITYDASLGKLVWTDTLRILFNRTDGQAIQNTVAAGNISPSDNEFVYLDLSETNNAVLTAAKAAVTTAAASNFLAYNRVVLGYRNAASDRFWPVYLQNVQEAIIDLASGSTQTVNWALSKTQRVKLVAHDIVFTFSGGAGVSADERLILILINDGSGSHTITLPGTVRYGTDIASYTMTVTASKGDRLGFFYDLDATKYDLVSVVKGF
jgi:hypothetical protein